jgi:hypothetical protein
VPVKYAGARAGAPLLKNCRLLIDYDVHSIFRAAGNVNVAVPSRDDVG